MKIFFQKNQKIVLTSAFVFGKVFLGRCGSCDFEHRQMDDGWGLTALFVGLGSWSQLIKTNCRLAPSGAKLEGWSLLLAAASSRASI
jgi:hypothetical protein